MGCCVYAIHQDHQAGIVFEVQFETIIAATGSLGRSSNGGKRGRRAWDDSFRDPNHKNVKRNQAGRGQRTTGFVLSMRDWEGVDKLWKAAGAPVDNRRCTSNQRACLMSGGLEYLTGMIPRRTPLQVRQGRAEAAGMKGIRIKICSEFLIRLTLTFVSGD